MTFVWYDELGSVGNRLRGIAYKHLERNKKECPNQVVNFYATAETYHELYTFQFTRSHPSLETVGIILRKCAEAGKINRIKIKNRVLFGYSEGCK